MPRSCYPSVRMLRFLFAVPLGLAPRRYWPSLDTQVPVFRAAFASALATFLLSVIISVPAFFAYAQGNASSAVDMMLQSTGWRTPPPGAPAPTVAGAQITWVSSSMMLPAFLFFTPIGLFSTYLTVTGVVRMISAFVDDARGDPILSTVDSVARRLWNSSRRRAAAHAREKREGVDVPDVLVTGAAAGLPDADIVVIASRRKADWDAGAIVVTDDKWFTLGAPVEQQMPAGWRTLYPLTELHHHEVLRRAVRYTLPPLAGARSTSAR